jgi:protease-4
MNMPTVSPRARSGLATWLLVLAGVLTTMAVIILIAIAAIRLSHHVAAVAEIAAIIIASLLILAFAARRLFGRTVSRGTILELDLENPVAEVAPSGPEALLAMGGGRTQSLREVVETIRRAASDDRVAALYVRSGRALSGLGQVQELRDAVLDFRAAGKRAVVFSETFGESSTGNGSYYLATAFDEIALQPSGELNLTGLMASVTFLRSTFEKLGLVPRFDHRREYKTAMNRLTETDFTPAHRESLEHVIRIQFDQMVRGIAQGRNLPEPDVRALADRGPFQATAAHEAGLVDRLAYRDQVIAALKAHAGDGAQMLYLSHYAKRSRPARARGVPVAVIYGVGGIRRGKTGGGLDPFRGWQPFAGSDTVGAAFRSAVDDKRVKAILFRVDSPGGSYVASDAIWRETVRAREAGKPVIVSMGNLAGSGGYFVAMAADKIVAQPGTITGSIGVFGGKVVTAGLRERLGLSTKELHTSDNATMFSDALDYSPPQWEKMEEGLDHVYADFTAKVASGRGLAPETVQDVAKGRIWTGEDAKRLGLVDELGGYQTALDLVRAALGQPEDAPLRVKLYPRPQSRLARLRPSRRENSEHDATVRLVSMFGDNRTLSMPIFELTL